jgi:hypothetical protein
MLSVTQSRGLACLPSTIPDTLPPVQAMNLQLQRYCAEVALNDPHVSVKRQYTQEE